MAFKTSGIEPIEEVVVPSEMKNGIVPRFIAESGYLMFLNIS